MIHFPQLSSGAVVQLPVRQQRLFRTVRTVCEDGTVSRWSDAGHRFARWDLRFVDLSSEETQALLMLFESVEGKLGEFVFYDPIANLLCWSEDLSKPVWQREAGVTVAATADRPPIAESASTVSNPTAVDRRISQSVSIPGAYQATVSAWVKGAGSITMLRSSGGWTESRSVTLSDQWHRVSFASAIPGGSESSEFGFSIPSAGVVQISGVQVDAQPAASPYRRASAHSGVYASARLDDDALAVTYTANGLASIDLQVVACVEYS